jgi:hypothetical protein
LGFEQAAQTDADHEVVIGEEEADPGARHGDMEEESSEDDSLCAFFCWFEGGL